MKENELLHFMEKFKNVFLVVCLLVLIFPTAAFAECGNINSIGLFNFTVVVLILFMPFLLINIDYLKSSFEDSNLLILNFIPLIICPFISYVYVKIFLSAIVQPQYLFFNALNKAIGLMLIYYFFFLIFGVTKFYGEERVLGGDIIKFCVSMIIALLAIFGFLNVMISMSGC